MRTCLKFVVGVLALCSLAQAAERRETWDGSPKPLKGDYQIYGGELGDMVPPTKKDRKVAFMFKEPLAKELFDQIGPDTKTPCSGAEDYRERNKGDLSCTYTKSDGYSCYLGLNVPTGKSINGATC
ncbi:hypothetical protein SRABI118_00326 [Massilia sp. Bi118]|nr:hypothetical protein SRABI118_00326 [Massilia sp. Bi118]